MSVNEPSSDGYSGGRNERVVVSIDWYGIPKSKIQGSLVYLWIMILFGFKSLSVIPRSWMTSRVSRVLRRNLFASSGVRLELLKWVSAVLPGINSITRYESLSCPAGEEESNFGILRMLGSLDRTP